MNIEEIVISVLTGLLGFSLGALLMLHKLYMGSKDALMKLWFSIVEKVHGVEIDFGELWKTVRPYIDEFVKERHESKPEMEDENE